MNRWVSCLAHGELAEATHLWLLELPPLFLTMWWSRARWLQADPFFPSLRGLVSYPPRIDAKCEISSSKPASPDNFRRRDYGYSSFNRRRNVFS